MIFLDSRYVDGKLFKAKDSRTGKTQISVFRTFPTDAKYFFIYEWVETDRIDNIANLFLGSPNLWWKIMDFNPEILNPFNIEPGTQLRIPNE